MPYIIARQYPCPVGLAMRPQKLHAVATLDEARAAAVEATGGACTIAEHNRTLDQAAAITDHGGTVGPLPDGTMIKVERVGWNKLVPDPHRYTDSQIIATFNAQQ